MTSDNTLVLEENRSVHVSYQQYVCVFHEKVMELVQKYAPDQGAVVDVGCGTGVTLSLLKEQGTNLSLHGADFDETCLKNAGEKVRELKIFKMNESESIDISQIEGLYDVSILSHVLEHVEYPLKTLKKMTAITKKGGFIILATPNPVRPNVFFSNLIRRHYVNRGHVHAWDRSHWINFLENIGGYEVVEYPVDEVRLIPHRLIKKIPVLRKLNILASSIAPWWSFSNIAVIKNV